MKWSTQWIFTCTWIISVTVILGFINMYLDVVHFDSLRPWIWCRFTSHSCWVRNWTVRPPGPSRCPPVDSAWWVNPNKILYMWPSGCHSVDSVWWVNLNKKHVTWLLSFEQYMLSVYCKPNYKCGLYAVNSGVQMKCHPFHRDHNSFDEIYLCIW